MKGYFLSVDILGFSKIIQNIDSKELQNRIEEWISAVKEECEKHSIDRYQLISDTLFVGKSEKAEDLKKLVKFSSSLLTKCIEIAIPLRGAISFGQYEWTDELVYGKAVIDAHQYEENQDWIGIACVPDTLDIPDDLWGEVICYPVPLKKGKLMYGAVVKWKIPGFEKLSLTLTSKGLSKPEESLDHKWMNKIEKTIMFSIYLRILSKFNHVPSKFHGFGPMHAIDEVIDL